MRRQRNGLVDSAQGLDCEHGNISSSCHHPSLMKTLLVHNSEVFSTSMQTNPKHHVEWVVTGQLHRAIVQ